MARVIHLNSALPQPPWRELLEGLPEITRRLPRSQLVQGGRNDIYRFERFGRRLAVKRFVNEGPWKKVAYRFATSKARRSYEGSEALRRAGLQAPQPLGWLEERDGPWLRESYFLCDYLDVVHEARSISNEPGVDWRPLVRLIARSIARMHEAGILHLDLTPGNLLFVDVGGPEWELHFVDNNRMRFGPVGFAAGMRSLLQPAIEGPLAEPYLEAYARARGFDLERCRRFYRSAQRRYKLKWRMKDATRPWRRKIGL